MSVKKFLGPIFEKSLLLELNLYTNIKIIARVAQLVEQSIEAALVVSSNLISSNL
jgi:hypothetical protein